jgi:hypothetical protein
MENYHVLLTGASLDSFSNLNEQLITLIVLALFVFHFSFVDNGGILRVDGFLPKTLILVSLLLAFLVSPHNDGKQKMGNNECNRKKKQACICFFLHTIK